jgi:cation diffusion facilitator family transporter
MVWISRSCLCTPAARRLASLTASFDGHARPSLATGAHRAPPVEWDMKSADMNRPGTVLSPSLTHIAMLNIVVAFAVMGLKYMAYHVTGSVALYSDALESVVNIVTAVAALVAIRVSSLPADRNHPFGHAKAEYFSAVLEGVLVIVAALMILREAYLAFLAPRVLEQPALGLAINGAATLVNAAWAAYLVRRGRQLRSPALAADGWHLVTDVWTSLGVIVGLILAAVTHMPILDPVLATLVAANILWAGYKITSSSVGGLMDAAVDAEMADRIRATIRASGHGAMQVHDIRARHAGRITFIEFHLVVPGSMMVSDAHEICDRIEDALEAELENTDVSIHIEPDDKAKTKAAVIF